MNAAPEPLKIVVSLDDALRGTLSALGPLAAVAAERARQDEKWGEQNHPDGTGPTATPLYSTDRFLDDTMSAERLSEMLKRRTDLRFHGDGDRPGTWADILLEEVFEALAESDAEKLRTELIQVAAVATQWVEAIDRRGGPAESKAVISAIADGAVSAVHAIDRAAA